MILTGALCWWNEKPQDLDACIRGLGQVADRVVALDGAYRRYPAATPRSSEDQLAAIREAAAAVNIECRIIQPDFLWAGQVEKRSHLLAMASIGSDWIATVDADHVITADRAFIRDFLSRVREDVIDVAYVTPVNPKRSLRSSVGQWHIDQSAEPTWVPLFWRVYPGMQVERRHWWYSAMRRGERVWLWGGEPGRPDTYHGRTEKVQVEHRTLFRTAEQIRLSRAFLNDRIKIVEQTGQEDWQPGMDDPVWDYGLVEAV